MEEVKIEDKKWCVYMHVNKVNNKVYVGQTCQQPPEKRWGNDGAGYKCNGGNRHFQNAIQKYGWDNFEHIIFANNLSKEDADKIETLLIALYETTNHDKGYNIAVGGNVHVGVGENNPFYGKHHTDDTKNRLSEVRSIPVVQLNLNGEYIKEFRSGREASRATGVDESTINDCCIKKPHCKSGGGFLWVYKKDYNSDNNISYDNSALRPVVQLDKLGNFIAEYNTIKNASIITSVHNSNITVCCKGDYNHAGGYIWVYKEEYDPNKTYIYKNPVYREVVQIDVDGNIVATYESITEASNTTGIKNSTISRCCAKDGTTAGGFVWKYADQDYDIEKIKSTNYKKRPTRLPVIQYDLEGNFIAEYKSIADAVRNTNASKTRILSCCHGEQEQTKGFIWKWKYKQGDDSDEL